jgi:hypothetical protein
MADTIALAFENSFRIRKSRTLIKSKVHVFGIDCNVKNPIAQTLATAVADSDGAVRVIDVLVTGRHLFEHERPKLESEIANLRIVRFQKLSQGGWNRIRHARILTMTRGVRQCWQRESLSYRAKKAVVRRFEKENRVYLTIAKSIHWLEDCVSAGANLSVTITCRK